jgi:RNA polymerase sigma-70 factor (ECF subfamily)
MEVATIAPVPTKAADRDLELIERHRLGDPSAFDEIFERYQRMVFNLALRLSGDPERAEDLSQEIFLRIYRHVGRFKGRSSLKTWVYRVSVNCCRSRLSRRRPPIQVPADPTVDLLDRVRDTSAGPERRAIARERMAQVMEALRALPRPYREAVVLRDVEELTYEEIAEVLDVRIGTVRSRIARGRVRLRQLVEESE